MKHAKCRTERKRKVINFFESTRVTKKIERRKKKEERRKKKEDKRRRSLHEATWG